MKCKKLLEFIDFFHKKAILPKFFLIFSPAKVAQILIGVATLCTFGLQFFIPMDILWRKVSPRIQRNHHNIAQILIRGVMVLILGGFAAAVPKLDAFIGLVGAIFFSSLGEWMVFLLSFFKEVLSSVPR